jgi:hypothetical protein
MVRMKKLELWLWLVCLAATLCAFAPLIPTLARSAYGFRPVELWFATAYLLVSSSALLAFWAWLLRKSLKTRSPSRLVTASMVVPVGSIALLLLPYVPTALLLLQVEIFGEAIAPHSSLLATKYLHAFSSASWEFHTWIVFPAVLAAMFIVVCTRQAGRTKIVP